MSQNLRKQAEELSKRPYTEVVYQDTTTDGDFIFLAVTPELEGCMAQGETLREARANLREFRVDYIEHLLEHNLPIPDPAWMATKTGAISTELQPYHQEPTVGEAFDLVAQPDYRQQRYGAQLRIETEKLQLPTTNTPSK